MLESQILGEIPDDIASATSLSTILDLSNDSLVGRIPPNFWSSLAVLMLNMSYNNLECPVPSNGMLMTINPNDLIGNAGLCGGALPPPCSAGSSTAKQQMRRNAMRYKGISHYEGPEADNHTALTCPGELLVEEHHSNYGEPWAGGRDVFEFLADSSHLSPKSHVLEIGCGTLRVGLHFIRYLNPEHFHCLERDELSLMAPLRYELASQGLLHKRPLIVRGEAMDFTKFGSEVVYDLIYARGVFLHMPDKLVWVGLERLANKLRAFDGRIFVSHNMKFCSRLGGDVCAKSLNKLGLEYIGKKTHDSLLFNHTEIWFEFRRTKA